MKYRTCSPWRDLPDELGSFQTAHNGHIKWAVDGTWARTWQLLATSDAYDDAEWTVSVDSTICRADQHVAGAVRGRRPAGPVARSDRSPLPPGSARRTPAPHATCQAVHVFRRRLPDQY
ncbi:transposase (plasmid) [Streptomyces tendae]|uniref:Transposase n=1 Tax=Streptomyces tendae TaxID=1932 RepID=A0ABX6A1K8_STRTE|nr:transposase [Streptomyces tendae]